MHPLLTLRLSASSSEPAEVGPSTSSRVKPAWYDVHLRACEVTQGSRRFNRVCGHVRLRMGSPSILGHNRWKNAHLWPPLHMGVHPRQSYSPTGVPKAAVYPADSSG